MIKMSANRSPEMETYEQAEAMAKERGDQIYVCAFMIKGGILGRFMEAAIGLSPKVREPEGSLQSGKAWKVSLRSSPPLPAGLGPRTDSPPVSTSCSRFVRRCRAG